MGEARNSTAQGEYLRFHAGVDIADTLCGADGNTVGAIYAGVVIATGTDVPGCTGVACVRIQDSASHAFDYIHVDWAGYVSERQSVVANQIIGTIAVPLPLLPHLHLNDVDLANGVKLNPQRVAALDFVDTQTPIPVPITMSGSNNVILSESLIPIQALTGTENAVNTTINPFTRIASDGSVLIAAPADFLFSVSDSASIRKGVYSVGLNVEPYAGQSVNPAPSFFNISFDDVLDLNPYTGALSVYDYPLEPLSFVPFASHSYQGVAASESSPVDFSDPSQFPSGEYLACAFAVNNPVYADQGFNCLAITVDRTPPGLTVFDSSGLQIATGTYTKTPSISVQVDDALSGPGGVEVDDNGVFIASTAASFPPPSYAYTSSNLPVLGNIPEGNVQITGYDQAGNATTTNFIVDHTPPLSVVLSPKDASSMPALQLPGFVISGTAEEGCIKEA